MTAAGQIFALVAGLIHIMVFGMESIFFSRAAVRTTFGVAAGDLQAVRPWAFNQGFYNLFLAVGDLAGVILLHTGEHEAGRALVALSCGSMLAAALVLLATNRRMLRAATIQGLAPLLALALLFI
jgi:putative membrane protein